MRTLSALALLLLPVCLGAQSAAAPASAGRPLAQFVAERAAVTPVQFWRADSVGWSVGADGAKQRAEVDSAIAEVFRERGMGNRWAFAGDVVRSARRNPTLRSDPTALGAGRWRNLAPEQNEQVPSLLADNLRVVSALGDTRYAFIPVELRAVNDRAILRVVLVDTRRRAVVWYADLVAVVAQPTEVADALATLLADLVIDP